MRQTTLSLLTIAILVMAPAVIHAADETSAPKSVDIQVAQSTPASQESEPALSSPPSVDPAKLLPAPAMDAIRSMNEMRRMVEALNDDLQRGFGEGWGRYSGGADFRPAVDIMETPTELIISCDMPGVAKEDIKVEATKELLIIKGARAIESGSADSSFRFHRRERSYGVFERSFRLPSDMDPERVTAEYKDGVLRLAVPKTSKEKTVKIEVK